MRKIGRAFFVAFSAPFVAAFAMCQVREFVPPPALVPQSPEASQKLSTLFAAPKPSPSQNCEQATVDVDGRIVTVDLNETYADLTIFNPSPNSPWPNHVEPLHLRSYGGCKMGPLIAVNPGDTLRVNLINELPVDDPSCLPTPPPALGLPPGVGCFNTINLHTHGLHVSPTGNSDNVLLNIQPQTKFEYEINIPEDHPAGTFWYHAHRHGSTAVQVTSGAAGILVVRGNRPYRSPTKDDPHPIADIDTVLHHADGTPFTEHFFFMQQLAYACFSNPPGQDGGPWQQLYTVNGFYNATTANVNPPIPPNSPAVSEWTCPLPSTDPYVSPGVIENFGLQLFSASIWDTNGRFTTVNGEVQPTITVPAGDIQRWRFVHAGIHDTINLQIVPAADQRGPHNFVAASALVGNRLQQAAEVQVECPSTMETLVPQFAIAADGLTMTRLHTLAGKSEAGSDGANYLQPGYRSDILVAFRKDGWYCLLDQAAPQSQRFNPTTGTGGGSGRSTQQLLAYIHVVGGHPVSGDLEKYVEDMLYAANPQLPEQVRRGLRSGDLTPWAPFVSLPPPPASQEPLPIDFAITGAGQFQIKSTSYDPNVVNITRQVNTTDDWILSVSGPTTTQEPHIFHIHVNPFEVTDVVQILPDGTQRSIFDSNGGCKKEAFRDQLANQYCGMLHTFRDTVFVEPGFDVHIRQRYDRYIGEFVLHCHILDHEDAGMMLNVEIVPDISQPGGGLGMSTMKHSH